MAANRIKLKDRLRLISEYDERGRGWFDQSMSCRTLKAWLKCRERSEYYYRMARYHRWVYIWELKHPRKKRDVVTMTKEEAHDSSCWI